MRSVISRRASVAPALALVIVTTVATACQKGESATDRAPGQGNGEVAATAAPATGESASAPAAGAATPATPATSSPVKADAGAAARTPNELGRIPVLEYHLIGDKNALYERTRDGFRRDLELLYARGYRPVNMVDVVDRKIDLPAGMSPVVIVFDDASPSQFRYVEKNGQLEIDPTTAVGIWVDFRKQHPDWPNKAVFCTLSGAAAGRSFFGDKGIEGQKSEWRFRKVQWLHEQGFELCNHTLWHANLARYGDAVVQEQIARGQMAIDSAVPGYRVRTFALPQGAWPKNRPLAIRGSWTDPKTGTTISYHNEAVLEVAGGPDESPYDPKWNGASVARVQVIGDSAVARTLDQLEKAGKRYVSDGDAESVARGAAPATGAGAR